MKISQRQKTLSFKVTQSVDEALATIRLQMSQKRKKVITKTDVIEEAIRLLAKREKVEVG